MGASAFGRECAYRLAAGELEILNLAVDPANGALDWAAVLLEAALRRGAAAGVGRALLEVRASNDAARSLYAKSGFVAIGLRKDILRRAARRRPGSRSSARPGSRSFLN
jgi:ribosomal-protein-alanine N-acetyltransferase